MLHEFLTSNRQLEISRCSENVAAWFGPAESKQTTGHGVPVLLQQLIEILRDEQNTAVRSADSAQTPPTEIGRAAALHGAELLFQGFYIRP